MRYFRKDNHLYQYRYLHSKGGNSYSSICGYDDGPYNDGPSHDSDEDFDWQKQPFKCSQAELIDLIIQRQADSYEELCNLRGEMAANFTVIVSRFDPVGFVLFECVMIDSSRCGERTILPYGGRATLQEIPSVPMSPRGLAVVAYCEV